MRKETIASCSTCSHRLVCQFKEQFIKADQAVKSVVVNIEDNESVNRVNLSDISFIKPVELVCVNYEMEKPVMRNAIDLLQDRV